VGWARENGTATVAEPRLKVLTRQGYREHNQYNYTIPVVVRKHTLGI